MIKVKICGIKTREAAIAADQNSADFIGFIFHKQSKRFIHPFTAGEISRSIKRAKKVGVFVDDSVEFINDVVNLVKLDYVQLHGNEDAKIIQKIRAPIIKAWRFNDKFNAKEADNFPCEIVLLDSYVEGYAGGSGKIFNWHKAAVETKKINKPILIAGGISIENFQEVVDIFQPYGVDVSSSLEVNGVKSVNKIADFLKFAKHTCI